MVHGIAVSFSWKAATDKAEKSFPLMICDLNPATVLVIGDNNNARSQMAEAFLRYYAQDTIEVYSAGLDAGDIPRLAYDVMAEAGISLTTQYAKSVDLYAGLHFDFIINLSRDPSVVRHFSTYQQITLAFDDPECDEDTPHDQIMRFRRVRDEINTAMQVWISHVLETV
jgi:arsenate reductase (thioredoxin)